MDADRPELVRYRIPIELSYTTTFTKQQYRIVDMLATQYNVHVLLERDAPNSDNNYILYVSLAVSGAAFVGLIFIIIAAVVIISIFVVVKQSKKRDIYRQLLDLESKSENEMPLLLPSKFDCFKINF